MFSDSLSIVLFACLIATLWMFSFFIDLGSMSLIIALYYFYIENMRKCILKSGKYTMKNRGGVFANVTEDRRKPTRDGSFKRPSPLSVSERGVESEWVAETGRREG